MQKVMLGMFMALALVAVSGCKKKGGDADAAAAKLDGFAKQMCDCKDKACGDGVNEAMAKWSQEAAKSAPKEGDKVDPKVAEKMATATTKLGDCYSKLVTAAAGAAAGGAGSATAGSAAGGEGSAAAGSGAADGSAAAGSGAADGSAAAAGSDKKPDDGKAGGW